MNVIVSLNEFSQRVNVGLIRICNERDNVVVVCLVVRTKVGFFKSPLDLSTSGGIA